MTGTDVSSGAESMPGSDSNYRSRGRGGREEYYNRNGKMMIRLVSLKDLQSRRLGRGSTTII